MNLPLAASRENRALWAHCNCHAGSGTGFAGPVAGDLQGRFDPVGTLTHDLDPVGVVAPLPEAAAVVADADAGCRGADPAVDPQVLRPRVLAGVGDRLLGDAEELGLH